MSAFGKSQRGTGSFVGGASAAKISGSGCTPEYLATSLGMNYISYALVGLIVMYTAITVGGQQCLSSGAIKFDSYRFVSACDYITSMGTHSTYSADSATKHFFVPITLLETGTWSAVVRELYFRLQKQGAFKEGEDSNVVSCFLLHTVARMISKITTLDANERRFLTALKRFKSDILSFVINIIICDKGDNDLRWMIACAMYLYHKSDARIIAFAMTYLASFTNTDFTLESVRLSIFTLLSLRSSVPLVGGDIPNIANIFQQLKPSFEQKKPYEKTHASIRDNMSRELYEQFLVTVAPKESTDSSGSTVTIPVEKTPIKFNLLSGEIVTICVSHGTALQVLHDGIVHTTAMGNTNAFTANLTPKGAIDYTSKSDLSLIKTGGKIVLVIADGKLLFKKGFNTELTVPCSSNFSIVVFYQDGGTASITRSRVTVSTVVVAPRVLVASSGGGGRPSKDVFSLANLFGSGCDDEEDSVSEAARLRDENDKLKQSLALIEMRVENERLQKALLDAQAEASAKALVEAETRAAERARVLAEEQKQQAQQLMEQAQSNKLLAAQQKLAAKLALKNLGKS